MNLYTTPSSISDSFSGSLYFGSAPGLRPYTVDPGLEPEEYGRGCEKGERWRRGTGVWNDGLRSSLHRITYL